MSQTKLKIISSDNKAVFLSIISLCTYYTSMLSYLSGHYCWYCSVALATYAWNIHNVCGYQISMHFYQYAIKENHVISQTSLKSFIFSASHSALVEGMDDPATKPNLEFRLCCLVAVQAVQSWAIYLTSCALVSSIFQLI